MDSLMQALERQTGATCRQNARLAELTAAIRQLVELNQALLAELADEPEETGADTYLDGSPRDA